MRSMRSGATSRARRTIAAGTPDHEMGRRAALGVPEDSLRSEEWIAADMPEASCNPPVADDADEND